MKKNSDIKKYKLNYDSYKVDDVAQLKKKMLNWANRFNIFCFLDNFNYSIQPNRYECLLAVDATSFIVPGTVNDLENFISASGEWSFGHFSYELKDAIHHLHSSRKDIIGFPLFFFFKPAHLLSLQDGKLVIHSENPGQIYEEVMKENKEEDRYPQVSFQQKLSREEYLKKIRSLKEHIKKGDCYEINFCQEFYAEEIDLDPVAAFFRLSAISQNPFSALYKLDEKYLICASPERFLFRDGNKILSQPMKGTIRRSFDSKVDADLKMQLETSEKDKAENVMIVDLMRNDLSRICKYGTVRATELFKVYPFPKVYQMISTIEGELKESTGFSEIISATFPMGSMTGAPKRRVMELIEEYEVSARGIFSGSVGYVDPSGNFDLNVVIRSLMYNASSRYLSYQVGSGITFYSDPEKEWEECMLKGMAIRSALGEE